MNTTIKTSIIILLSIIGGLALGYLLFNNKPQSLIQSAQKIQHDHTSVEALEEGTWTCSMHPQIRQSEPGICPICEMDLTPLEVNTSDDPLVLQMTKEAAKLAQVQTTLVGNAGSSETKEIALSGKIQADERQASSLVSHVPGRIEKLYITFTGEQVNVGQKLATVYSPNLIAAQKELIEAKKLEDISPGLLGAVRNKLKYWKIDPELIAQIESSGEIKETFDLFAERSGVVTQRRVSVGDYIQQGETLFDIINLSKVWVLFDTYEEDLNNISIGNRIEFRSPVIPGKSFKTRVTFIDPVINPQTRTAAVRAEINNRNATLKPEMFVSGILKEPIKKNSKLMVPKTAVLWTGKRSVVYVKVPDMAIPSYQYREVELGESLGDVYLILSGLEDGEEVVTNGAFSIDAAAQLNNQQSMMNKKVNLKVAGPKVLPDFKTETPSAFKEQLNLVAEKYLLLKDAFVATNKEAAKTITTEIIEQIGKTDMSLIKGQAHDFWMEKRTNINHHAQLLIKQEGIEAQRKQFQFISEILIETLKVFGISGKALYIQHCPMAFDNEGADWIAKEKEIRNPYFGDKMLKCGSVKAELETNK